MNAVLDLLFTSPAGLLTLFIILFIISMGVALAVWYKRNMNKPEQ